MTNDDKEEDYKALRGAISLTVGLSAIAELVGGGALLLAIFGVILGSSFPVPYWQTLIACALIAGIGLIAMFSGWRLHINAELMVLQIDLAEDAARAADAVKETQTVIQSTVAKLELQLRSISSSTARTAEAVEALAATVKRP